MASWQSAYPALSGEHPTHSLLSCAVLSSSALIMWALFLCARFFRALFFCALCMCALFFFCALFFSAALLSCAFLQRSLCVCALLPLCFLLRSLCEWALFLCVLFFSSFVRFSSALYVSGRSSSSAFCFSVLFLTHAAAATLAEWTYIIISPRAVYFGTLDDESDKTFAILVFAFTALSYMFSVLFKWEKGAKSDKMWSITGERGSKQLLHHAYPDLCMSITIWVITTCVSV